MPAASVSCTHISWVHQLALDDECPRFLCLMDWIPEHATRKCDVALNFYCTYSDVFCIWEEYCTHASNLKGFYNPSTLDRYAIIDDYNLTDINWYTFKGNSTVLNEFWSIVFDLNLIQIIYWDKSTHIQGNMLDLIVSDNEDQLHSLTIFLTAIFSNQHTIMSVSLADT